MADDARLAVFLPRRCFVWRAVLLGHCTRRTRSIEQRILMRGQMPDCGWISKGREREKRKREKSQKRQGAARKGGQQNRRTGQVLGYDEQGDAGRAGGEGKRRSQQERATQGTPRKTAKLREMGSGQALKALGGRGGQGEGATDGSNTGCMAVTGPVLRTAAPFQMQICCCIRVQQRIFVFWAATTQRAPAIISFFPS